MTASDTVFRKWLWLSSVPLVRLNNEDMPVRIASPELGRKLAARVKLFRFEDRDVAPVTTTKPIDFFPAG